jgi:uncharacterized membrane protein (UPF0127 family)
MFTIHVEIADDIDEQKDGLSNRLTLDDDSGMLFVYKSKSKQRFWMKDTYIPLDISFVDDVTDYRFKDRTYNTSVYNMFIDNFSH